MIRPLTKLPRFSKLYVWAVGLIFRGPDWRRTLIISSGDPIIIEAAPEM